MKKVLIVLISFLMLSFNNFISFIEPITIEENTLIITEKEKSVIADLRYELSFLFQVMQYEMINNKKKYEGIENIVYIANEKEISFSINVLYAYFSAGAAEKNEIINHFLDQL